jgi:hypothetical protein
MTFAIFRASHTVSSIAAASPLDVQALSEIPESLCRISQQGVLFLQFFDLLFALSQRLFSRLAVNWVAHVRSSSVRTVRLSKVGAKWGQPGTDAPPALYFEQSHRMQSRRSPTIWQLAVTGTIVVGCSRGNEGLDEMRGSTRRPTVNRVEKNDLACEVLQPGRVKSSAGSNVSYIIRP